MPPAERLKRELGAGGSILLGLGSILGAGVFVSLAIGAGVAGPAVILAIVIAAAVATCNGLSSAQLAAAHPVSGGTYEYGYTFLRPVFGFLAGWLFICAKSASAATAGLGLAGYLLAFADADTRAGLVWIALAIVIVLTLLVISGLRRTHVANTLIVSITVASLLLFILAGVRPAFASGAQAFEIDRVFNVPVDSLLQAAALMFVAYTGYGRIATLGEEVRRPTRTIPVAIIATLIISMTLYLGVSVVAIGVMGADDFAATQQRADPLVEAAKAFERPLMPELMILGAVTAMLGVVLNLILGLSRVVLAMARRRDAPAALAWISQEQKQPVAAVAVVGAIIGGLVLIGDVGLTWSFSAFTVLGYYALTNAAALRLPRDKRLYPRIISWAGLLGCLGLAAFIDWRTMLAGAAVVVAGLIWFAVARRCDRSRPVEPAGGPGTGES